MDNTKELKKDFKKLEGKIEKVKKIDKIISKTNLEIIDRLEKDNKDLKEYINILLNNLMNCSKKSHGDYIKTEHILNLYRRAQSEFIKIIN